MGLVMEKMNKESKDNMKAYFILTPIIKHFKGWLGGSNGRILILGWVCVFMR